MKDGTSSILRRVGIRQLPGICQYPAKAHGLPVNQGGTADNTVYSSLTEKTSVRDFLFLEGKRMLMTKRWRRMRARSLVGEEMYRNHTKQT